MTKLLCHWWKPEAKHIPFWTYVHTSPWPWAQPLWRDSGFFPWELHFQPRSRDVAERTPWECLSRLGVLCQRTPGGVTYTTFFFFLSSRDWKSKIKVLGKFWFLMRPLSLAHTWPSSPCVLMGLYLCVSMSLVSLHLSFFFF